MCSLRFCHPSAGYSQESGRHVLQELLLRLLLAKHCGHVLTQLANNEHVDLEGTHALDKLIHLRNDDPGGGGEGGRGNMPDVAKG